METDRISNTAEGANTEQEDRSEPAGAELPETDDITHDSGEDEKRNLTEDDQSNIDDRWMGSYTTVCLPASPVATHLATYANQ